MSFDGIDIQGHDGDDDPCFQVFQKEMQLKDEAKRFKTREQFASKKLQRFSKQKQWRQQVKRTQQYLGLCTPRNSTTGSIEAICSDLEHLTVTARADSDLSLHGNLESLRNDFNSFIFFISVDVEAFEFNQRLITEIGISTLDTVDILGVLPEAKGNNWAAKMRSRHFRIREHSHRLNKVHVEGCPDQFHFGQSEWIHERDVVSTLQECFNPSPPSLSNYPNRIRKVVLVAHDVAADIKYLTELGFNVTRMISDCIDTSDLYKAAQRDARQSALSTLLLRYSIAARHLHNAGNDANYTLRVMIAIVLDVTHNKRTAEDLEIEKRRRIEAACEEAKAKVCTEFEGWSTSEDDDVPEPSTISSKMDRQQEKKGPGISKEPCRSDAKPTMKRANPHRRGRPAYLTHIDGNLDDVPVQYNPNFQDVSQESPVPFLSSSARGNSSNSHDEGRGRGRGRGRGHGHGHGHGRGRGQGRGQGQGQGQVHGQSQGPYRGEGRRGQGRG